MLATTVHGPGCRHARILLLPDDLDGLAVLDRFACGAGPVAFEAFLHLAPEVLATVAGPRRILAQAGARRIDLVPWPVAGSCAGLQIVNGRADRPGAMQGFAAQRPGALTPASRIAYAFAGQDTVCGGLLIATSAAVEERLGTLLRGARPGAAPLRARLIPASGPSRVPPLPARGERPGCTPSCSREAEAKPKRR